jgi:L-amino acid N-acyltransferase YncA
MPSSFTSLQVLIRPSTDTDIDAIAAFYRESVATGTASWEYEAPSVAEMAKRRHAVIANGFPYLVAEIDGRVVGYCFASTYRARIGYRFVVEDSIYVAPDMQGRGIGKMLLVALIGECEKLGFRQMIAVIGDSENARSITLHERCGFQHAGRFNGIGYKFGRWLDSVQMLRALGEGSGSASDLKL